MQGLSVFRGGFTREAAQKVTGASLRELMALVNKSLLDRAPAPSTTLRTGGRYKVHEFLRQYAAEKLGGSPAASEAARDRHTAYYTAALQGWGEDLKGPRQQTVLAEMDVEIKDARTAWDWAAERGQVEQLDQAIDGLCHFYARRLRYQEGEAAGRLAAHKLEATVCGDGLRVWAKTLAWQGCFSLLLDHIELASQLLQQSLALLEGPELADRDTQSEKAFVLTQMGRIASGSDREQARRLFEQSLALYQALSDRWGMANVLENLRCSLPIRRLCQSGTVG